MRDRQYPFSFFDRFALEVAQAQANSNGVTIEEGWNEVRFNTAQEYTITGSEQLLFGFAYNETEDMVADKAGALCFDVSSAVNDNASLIEKEGAFYNIDGLGNLCVQLILDVSNLPERQADSAISPSWCSRSRSISTRGRL